MQFPIWHVPSLQGGLLIALIAVVHVYVAHFAVGGGFYLVLTELMGRRTGDDRILAYVKKHTKFFILLTMVFGSLTGVGIWFTIAILSPEATLTLIRTFTFAWSTEWVFFLAEIVTLLVYYYTFDKMRARTHLTVGWLYAGFAFLSLVMINGIIGFMLTPGDWVETRNFWAGFLNPTFWPQLFFRTFMALTFAGLFGFLTASRLQEHDLREKMVRYASVWVAAPIVFLFASAYWYAMALPEPQQTMILTKSHELPPFFKTFLIVSAALLVLGPVLAFVFPANVRKPAVYVVIALGLMQIGAFEFIREGGRRPYVIHDYIYSTSIKKEDMARINQEGLLSNAPWAGLKTEAITDENTMQAGHALFNIQCLSCHSVGGPMQDIYERTAKFTAFGMDAQLAGQGKLLGYMPPLAGTAAERQALASYIALELNANDGEPFASRDLEQVETAIPPFDPDAAEALTLIYPHTGMRFWPDAEPLFSLLPPKVEYSAVTILRDPAPVIDTEWATEGSGFTIPEGERVAHATLENPTPYTDEGFMPYPLLEFSGSGAAVQTAAVTPISTEMGCKRCHGGEWAKPEGDPVAGIGEATARDILRVHDRIGETDLLARADGGETVQCADCHADPAQDSQGDGQRLSLSAAIHGFHANYMPDMGETACQSCHPAHPDGATRFFRGFHADFGFTCTTCHGALEDHAISLLKNEPENPRSAALMEHLEPEMAETVEEINPRTPWRNLPDCAGCHDFMERPSLDATAFNKWTSGDPADLYHNRKDDMMAVPCGACHGPAHALYPAWNPYGENRDVIQPMQYQDDIVHLGKGPDCAACHTIEDMGYFVHHPAPE